MIIQCGKYDIVWGGEVLGNNGCKWRCVEGGGGRETLLEELDL